MAERGWDTERKGDRNRERGRERERDREPTGRPTTPADASLEADDPDEGLVSVRGGLVGIGYIWLTAVSAFGAIGAAVYGATVSAGYLLVAIVAAVVAIMAGSASLRQFGYR